MRLIKVCRMRDAANIQGVERAGADWIGFIFHPASPRYVSEIPAYLPQQARRVGVFVDAPKERIIETASLFGLELVQLHGSESPRFCEEIRQTGIGVIKSLSVGDRFPDETATEYRDTCDYFLFDTQTKLHGGSGRRFDWNLLSDYSGDTPFLLSGGIAPHDTGILKTLLHPKLIGIDINSRFEITPAKKDLQKIRHFIATLKS